MSNQQLVATFVLCLAIQVRGCIRRWRQPLLRGRDWFFNVPVEPSFYAEEGAKLLRHYRTRMFMPLLLDFPIVGMFLLGKLGLGSLLLLAQAGLIHWNHVLSVDRSERRARS